MTSVDVPSPEVVVNQTALILTLVISIGSVGGIAYKAYSGLTKRIKRSREEAEDKAEAAHEATRKYVDEKMREVNEVKERVEYIYRKIVEEYMKDKR